MEGQAERKPGTVKEGWLVNTGACVTLVAESGHFFCLWTICKDIDITRETELWLTLYSGG